MKSRSVSKCRNVRQELGPDQLVMKHLPLVKAIAAGIRRNLPAHVDLDDLVQAGALGLLDATRKYDTGKKVLFETYAKYRIRGAILDSLRNADWASRGLRKRHFGVNESRVSQIHKRSLELIAASLRSVGIQSSAPL